jgi:hypothetical protein
MLVRDAIALDVPNDAEAILELDGGAFVESEEVLRLLRETIPSQVLVETVREAEVSAMTRQPERGWQIDHDEVWLCQIQCCLR